MAKRALWGTSSSWFHTTHVSSRVYFRFLNESCLIYWSHLRWKTSKGSTGLSVHTITGKCHCTKTRRKSTAETETVKGDSLSTLYELEQSVWSQDALVQEPVTVRDEINSFVVDGLTSFFRYVQLLFFVSMLAIRLVCE